MPVRVCPKCRTMLTESSTICINCGTRFDPGPAPSSGEIDPPPPPPAGVNPDWAAAEAPTQPPSSAPATAPCGHPNPPGQTFCLTCGTSIPQGAAPAPPPGAYGAPPPYGSTPPPYGSTPPPYGGSPGYQTYYPGTGPIARKTNGDARNAMILGIVAVVFGLACCGIILGPPAIYLGAKARRQIAASPNVYEGDGMAIAGIVLGIISLAMTALTIIISIVSDSQTTY